MNFVFKMMNFEQAHACSARCMLYWDLGTRCARLIKSSNLPDSIVPYQITVAGVVDVQTVSEQAADGAVQVS